FFSLDGGWTAMRIAMHDYAQSEGIITDVYCGRRYSSLEYTYNAGKFPQHSRGPIASCRHYQPGGAVTVYYSTQNPDLSVINMSPGHYFRHDLKIAFLIALLGPLALGLVFAVKV